MKIAMLIDGWYPIYGGGQIHVEYLTKILSEKYDCKIDLFVRAIKGDDGNKYSQFKQINNNLRIFRVGPTYTFFNVFGRIVNLIVTTYILFYKSIIEKYDIIHAHAYVSGIPAKIVGSLLNIPVVYTIHGSMGLDAGNKGFMAKIESWLLTGIKYNLEISVSRKIFDYKNVNKNIQIIYNGVDIEKFEKIKVIKKYEGLNFLFVGRFDWQKGLEFLVETVNLIDKNLLDSRNVIFNLVGDGSLFEKIKLMTENYNLSKYFNFKGKIFGEELIREYKSNHIFILPSLAEGQPLVINEALISGLPIIATKVGDNEVFINNDENGYIINSGSIIELQFTIEKIINTSNENINKMGQKGYNFALKNLGWENTGEKTYNEYLKLIS